MAIRLEIICISLIVLFILFIGFRVKSKKINLRYSLLWIFASVVILILGFNDYLLNNIALLLGIKNVVNIIIFIGFILLSIVSFTLTTIVSIQNKKITSLVQEVGILKKELGSEKNE